MFDSLARLPPTSQLVAAAAEIPLTIVVSRAAARADTDALEAAGVQVLVATGENEPARVRSALDQLGALGVTSVLLEGGPHLAGAFLDAGEIDEIRLFLAPLLLGGSAARDPLEGEGVERISEALRALTLRLRARRRGPVDLRAPARVVRAHGGRERADVHGPDRRPRQRRPRSSSDDDGATLTIAHRGSRGELREGDSIAVNGVCLTATEVGDESFPAQAMLETLERSSLGALAPGRAVNLELRAARRRPPRRAHRAGPRRRHRHASRAIREEGFARVLEIEPEPRLARYLVEKGSVARRRREPDRQRAATTTASPSR